MEPTGVERVNRVLDRLPRDTLHLGARTVPAFRSMGVLGFHLAVLTAVLTAIRAGVPVLEAFGISATAGASFFAFGLLRRALTGRETLVLLEHVWVALGAVTLYLWAAGGPVLPGLDVLSVSLCVFLAAGRAGCLIAGCCHGHPATIGLVYPASAGLPERLHGVRLFPVQLVEAVGLLGIGLVGFVLAGSWPGTATVWVLAAYATVRFGVEALRGDQRPSVVGVSVPRAMAVLQLGAALVASEMWLVGSGPDRRHLAAAVPLAAVLVAGMLLDRSRRDPLAAWSHLDEVWSTIRTLARDAAGEQPVPATTSRGLRLAASWNGAGLHVSLSHPSRPVDGLPHALGLAPLARTATATHVIAPASRVGAPEPAGPDRRSDPAGAAPTHMPPDRLAVSGALSNPGDGYFGAEPSI